MRRRVYVESPYRADSPEGLRRNREYLIRCMRDSIARGESPFASHLLFTQFLDDDVPEERETGIECGLAWAVAGEATAVYTDLGISGGMRLGIDDAVSKGRSVDCRNIGVGEPGREAQEGLGHEAAEMRARMVAYMRKRSDDFCSDDIGLDLVADEIERGEDLE